MNAMMEASRHRIAEAKAADRSINIIIIYYSIELKLTVLCSVTHSLYWTQLTVPLMYTSLLFTTGNCFGKKSRHCTGATEIREHANRRELGASPSVK
jgi:hypothetical protein